MACNCISCQMASPDRQAAFQAFDFDNNPGWLDYKNNLTIPPGRNEASVLDRYKQKFYKLHVDPDFEIQKPRSSATPASASAPGTSTYCPPPRPADLPRRSASAQPSAASGRVAGFLSRIDFSTVIFLANALVVVMGFLAAFPLTPQVISYRAYRWALLGSMAASVIGIGQQRGVPPSPLKWEVFKTWLQPVLAGPELPALLHAAIFISLPRPISLAVVSPALYAAVTVAQHMQRSFNAAPLYQQYLEKGCRWIERSRVELQGAATSTEVSLGFLFVFFLLTPSRSLLPTLLYWQLLKLKYHSPASAYLHRATWTGIGAKVMPLVNRFAPFLQTPLNYAKRWFQST